ncbi:MAG: hypothetical protein AUH46_06465 [Gemmatimonadetes bacterium 13_1_40CM_70_15]|nr:MAG: hypothetical protein AUH46_06465 [Gemmatimonadetes bacterium 13_1_40CM_70_15]
MVVSAATLTDTSRSARSMGSKMRRLEVAPRFSSPPKASRNGTSDGSTIGWVRSSRVSWVSGPLTSVICSTLSPAITPRAVYCAPSPSNVAFTCNRRSARFTIAELRAVVRWMCPSAGMSSTSWSSTRIESLSVSMVEEANPTCCPPTSSR